jgi:hypothetical protein
MKPSSTYPEVQVKVKVQVARNAEGLLAQELAAKGDEAPEAEVEIAEEESEA